MKKRFQGSRRPEEADRTSAKGFRLLMSAATALVVMFIALLCQGADLPSVLVYTHNGLTLDGKKGYVHDNIAECVKAIEKIGAENHFKVVHSDDPGVFTNANLKSYRAIIFANSNNKAFDNAAERKAFQDYIHQGGGFVGIHSATGSERDWPWYWQLIGASFGWHPKLQKFTIHVTDKTHPATKFLNSDKWEWEDEFYVMKEQPKNVHVLLEGNINSLKDVDQEKLKALRAGKGDTEALMLPLAWYHDFEGTRSFYTALGHKKEYYSDPTYVKHLTGGILWAMRME
jgi:type 1 glutamine amidotransferase